MITMKVVVLIITGTAYFVTKCRWWIVRQLVGKATVVANCSLVLAEPIDVGSNEARLWNSSISVERGKVAGSAFRLTD